MEQYEIDFLNREQKQEQYEQEHNQMMLNAQPHLKELEELMIRYQKQVKGREALVSQCELDDISCILIDRIQAIHEEFDNWSDDYDFSEELSDHIGKITGGEF